MNNYSQSLVNGKPLKTISLADRGLAYADGLFETIAWVNGQLHNWAEHYKRLQLGAEQLLLNLPSEAVLLEDIARLKLSMTQDKLVKIIITRGNSIRGYQFEKKAICTRIILLMNWPVISNNYYIYGIDICVHEMKLAISPYFAKIKHLNCMTQVMAQATLLPKYQEAILCDDNNNVVSGISSNLFFTKDNILHIPIIDDCGVAGTMREEIIKSCIKLNVDYKISKYNIDFVINCDSVFFSNSIRGLWAVKNLFYLSKQYSYKLGNIYQQLTHQIHPELSRPFRQKN